MYDLYFKKVDKYFQDKDHLYMDYCILCDSSDFTHAFNSHDIVQCDKCGFVWRHRQPTPETLDKFYEESSALTDWAKIKNTTQERIRQEEKFKQLYQTMWARNVKSVLDYGCGNGFFLNNAPSTVDRKIGIEVNAEATKHCEFKVYSTLKDMLDVEKEKVDMVTMFGVLEHLPHPKAMLSILGEVSNKYIGIVVPNVESLVVQSLGRECSTFCPQHLWYYSIGTLTKLMSTIGYHLVESWTVEAETKPITKKFMFGNPYIKTGGLSLKYSLINEDDVLYNGLGYKIVALFSKEIN